LKEEIEKIARDLELLAAGEVLTLLFEPLFVYLLPHDRP